MVNLGSNRNPNHRAAVHQLIISWYVSFWRCIWFFNGSFSFEQGTKELPLAFKGLNWFSTHQVKAGKSWWNIQYWFEFHVVQCFHPDECNGANWNSGSYVWQPGEQPITVIAFISHTLHLIISFKIWDILHRHSWMVNHCAGWNIDSMNEMNQCGAYPELWYFQWL